MNKEKKKPVFKSTHIILVASFVLAYGLVQVIHTSLLSFIRAESNFLVQQHSEQTFQAENFTSPEDLILIESIVAIVKNYYVDEDRVGNENLLTLTLGRLQEEGRLKFQKNKEKIEIKARKKHLSLSIKAPYTLSHLVSHIVLISHLLTPENESIDQLAGGDLPSGQFIFLNHLLMALDPHSSLLDKYLYKELREGTEGSFGGLGVVVGIKENLLTVIKPIPNSPAARAGIRRKDKIIMINNQSTYGVTLESLVEHMRGDPGTMVDISLMRNGDYAPQKIALKREVIEVDSVTPTLVNQSGKRFLRLAIESFSARTSKEVRDLIVKHEKYADVDGIILDLRSNPGGLLGQAVNVSDLFLVKGTIVSTKGRRVEMEEAGIGYSEFSHPLIVLINSDSASASEIVAGALRDNNRAIILGQPSFGKGSVQTIFELPKEQALKLTIARYYTPQGHSIQNRGIYPDIWLQPIVKHKDNRNLLGDYRYRSERFLKNSLKADPSFELGKKSQMLGYYLVDEIDESPLDMEKEKDVELNLALSLLGKITSDYDASLPASSHRSSHYLARYHNFLKEKLAAIGKEASTYLEKNHNLFWAASSNLKERKNVLDLDMSYSKEVTLGSLNHVKADWKIKNTSNQDMERISFFVQSNGIITSTDEFLVGSVKKGETRKGSVKIPIHNARSLKNLILSSGLSQDGVPLYFKNEKESVKITQGPLADISISSEIIEQEGSIKGTLEAGEQAIIKLKVTNHGDGQGSDLNLKVANLAGRQIKLASKALSIGKLKSNESKVIALEVVGAATILSDELGLGLSVSGSNLLGVYRKRLGIPCKKNATRDKAAVLIGH